MGQFYWKSYKLYYFDEDNGKNYVLEFLETIAENDKAIVIDFLTNFADKIDEGKGIPSEMFEQEIIKKLESSSGRLYEYRARSKKLRKVIRIYFGVVKQHKIIVLLSGHFKKGKNEQQKEINDAEKRLKRFIRRRERNET
ncbi:type II toxin-antitoxin system RelE/ParE family toxin [Thermosipho ferrireducens]|uniref:Type II toxin-antitoxin system RelE/ParE family toxin n=1 Tax=Thermosipho ferrireducens TaxID=2571116 RepID=A0ABX7S9G6_9BACT|nr:type II toxin-antitoxin system RelE/ParE family toxin [Thermosipho ferrireducens]QTA38515.1 type II toxin-antitoxin system RelE/ParE family toxin [Thermosipho ferrireducens]